MQPNQPIQPTAPGMPVQPGATPAPAQTTQPVAPSQPSAMPGGADPLVAGAAAGVPGAGAPVVGMEAQPMAGATPGTMAPEMTAGTTGAPQDMSSLIDAELAKPVENSPMNPTPAMAVEKPKMNPWMIGTISSQSSRGSFWAFLPPSLELDSSASFPPASPVPHQSEMTYLVAPQ